MEKEIFLSNRDLEKLSIDEKRKYFSKIKDYCINTQVTAKRKNTWNEIITKIYPHLRNYDYEIEGIENIPLDAKGLFVCNHSNSHDFFTAHEVFKKIGSNVSVFAAGDDLDIASKAIFNACDSVLIDRNSKTSALDGIVKFSAILMNNIPGVIFGEATWNLHPFKPMQQIKIGSANIAAITEVPIIPTIFEYCEIPELCSSESKLYYKCIVKFDKPLYINRCESLISQTKKIQSALEQSRRELWEKLGCEKKSLLDVKQEVYLNHTYLKKFDALGFTYDSNKEATYLFSPDGKPVINEFHIDENGNFVPGVTEKNQKRILKK
jgi:1-acyl-sn-glycerol-3-phosphate acyltransferase